jgi:hypothetical protein
MNPFSTIESLLWPAARPEASRAGLSWHRGRSVVAAWALGMVALATPPVAMAEPMAVTTREAPREVMVTGLEVIGTSFTTGDGAGTTRPIYSVVVGDPRPAEERAYGWSQRFGMYALDADLWTRVTSDSNARWRRTTLRRPRTVEEIETFVEAPGVFKREILGGSGLLPFPLGDLAERELNSLDYVVQYFLGGTRAALRVGATRNDAETILGHVMNQMNRQ